MTVAETQVTVVIVDDDALVRDGIAAILDGQPGIAVIGRGGDGRDAVSLCNELEPDVVLLDIEMPRLDGLQALEEIKRSAPHVAVVMLTTFDTGPYIDQALRGGAVGFLLKSSTYEQLVAAVRSARDGHTMLSPSVTRHVVTGYLAARRPPDSDDLSRVQKLTRREREVLELIATGAPNSDIAAALHLSEHTVKTHVSHILTKTGCADRTQAAVLAHRIVRDS
ncbi:response regulator [Nocardioides sp. BYT-33-1]|uniref:response regulator n=1 Tax=Nocardioides sp. BYT-33-1 TaxID=3416952 RepID=UPI003F52E274